MHCLSALAWRNLQQHRMRTLLSIIGVALGVAMVLAADVTGDAIEMLHPERAGLRVIGRLRWSRKGFRRG